MLAIIKAIIHGQKNTAVLTTILSLFSTRIDVSWIQFSQCLRWDYQFMIHGVINFANLPRQSFLHMYLHTHQHIHVHVPTYTCTNVHQHIPIPTCTCTYTNIYMHTHIHIHICTFHHIHVPTYTNTHTYHHIHIHAPISRTSIPPYTHHQTRMMLRHSYSNVVTWMLSHHSKLTCIHGNSITIFIPTTGTHLQFR